MKRTTTLEKIVQKMPFEKIVGQTVMGYIDEAKNFDDLKEVVVENALSGLVLSSRSLSGQDPDSLLKELATSYRRALSLQIILAAENGSEGFEGISPQVTELPSQMAMGATGEEKSAYTAGYVTALELRSLGINASLTPIANLYSSEMGENCFGDDPDEVSSYVVSYIRGLRNGGVSSFVKYFPGKPFDKREGEQDLEILLKHDFKPFRQAFKFGVEGVVIGHSPLPAVKAVDTPSSLSHKVIEYVVKRKMGFRNILMTDFLDDERILKEFDLEEAAVKALKAGNHIIMPSRSIEKTQEVLRSIIERTREDEDLNEKVRNSALEVMSFKLRRFVKFKRTPKKTRGSIINRSKAWKIFIQSIAPVKGSDEFPLRWLGKPLVVVTKRLGERLGKSGRMALEKVLREELGGLSVLDGLEGFSSKKVEEIYRSIPSNTLLIILSYNTHEDGGELPILKKLVSFFRESVVISLGSPEDLTTLNSAKICIAAFTPGATAVKAALKVLKGEFKPMGRLPIKMEL